MFEYQPRRHPLQTFQFWFAILICTGGVIVWKYGPASKSKQTVELPSILAEEAMPPPPQIGVGQRIPELSSESDATEMAPLQSEEPAEELQSSIPVAQLPDDQPSERHATLRTADGSVEHEFQIEQTSLQTASRDVEQVSVLSGASQESLNPPQDSAAAPADVTSKSLKQLDFTEIDRLIERGDDVTALRTLSTWYWEYPERRRQLWNRLNLLSRRIYFQPQPHYMEPYEIQFGDRLETIAKNYNVSWEYLSKINRVDAERIKAGKKLKVIQGPFSAVVDLSEFEITVHAHGYFVVRMPVGIGKDGSTPIGTFKVTDKVIDPIYYGPDVVIKNDDPANPLGERWLAISDEAGTVEGYGIHGTIDPGSIGKAESRGCLRLHDQDVADLYDLLTIGSEVIIRR